MLFKLVYMIDDEMLFIIFQPIYRHISLPPYLRMLASASYAYKKRLLLAMFPVDTGASALDVPKILRRTQLGTMVAQNVVKMSL